MKTRNKVLALTLASTLLLPTAAHASNIDAVIDDIYRGMNDISQITGGPAVVRPGSTTTTTTTVTGTTTTTTTTVVRPGTSTTTPAPKTDNTAAVAALRKSLDNNLAVIRAAEDILNNYPNTIKGREEQIIDALVRAHKLRLKAADTLKNVTGEKLVVDSLNIPQEYMHLVKMY